MKHWIVVSPSMSYTEPVLDDGSGPTYDFRDVAYAEAENERDAIDVGVRVMEYWPKVAREDQINPWSSVTAESAECEHGFCWCDLEGCTKGHEANGHGDYCEACNKLHEALGESV